MPVILLHQKRVFLILHLTSFFTIMLLTIGNCLADSREVRVGVYENSPKVFTEKNGTPAGIFIDIIEEIARREDWTLHYVHGSWSQCLERLESGEIDLMLDVAYSDERAEKYDFCSDDVLSNWAQIYTRKGFTIKLITDLDGMKVATLRQGIHLERLMKLAEGFGLNLDLTQVDDYETVFRMLHENKVDAGVVNRVFGYAHEEQYNVTRSPVVFSPASLRFAVKKGFNTDVIRAIDQQLASMKAEKASAYNQSLKKWLGETTQLNLPQWIGWSLGAAAIVMLLLFVMSVLLKHQVNKKTEYLRLTNTQLERQVNETMKAHLELKHSEDLLIRQERLNALGQLTSGIAHDFNNMLIPILGYSDLLLENPIYLKDSERCIPMLQAIRSAADTSRETVKRLLEFHRADSRPKKEIVNIAELISEVVIATKPLWKSDREAYSVPIRVTKDIPPDLMIKVNKSQISEAVMNLLLNSLHAISNGGEVIIRAYSEAENLFLEVKDTGLGMTPEVARRCMEPFFSTKGENGTGMGLAMVHGIVNRHNGSLNIDSMPGKGTTITIKIPLAQEDTGIESDTNIVTSPIQLLNILVVDDDINSRALLSEYLSLDGHRVTTAANVSEGIEEFDTGEFDLVITDRAMPEISGDVLAKHVKSSHRPVSVLMITGFAQIMTSRSEHPAGVDYILAKPFTLQELRNALHNLYG